MISKSFVVTTAAALLAATASASFGQNTAPAPSIQEHRVLVAEERRSAPVRPRPSAETKAPAARTVQPAPQMTSPGGGPERLTCCTSFDTAGNFSGCATFEGSVCPDYAPYQPW